MVNKTTHHGMHSMSETQGNKSKRKGRVETSVRAGAEALILWARERRGGHPTDSTHAAVDAGETKGHDSPMAYDSLPILQSSDVLPLLAKLAEIVEDTHDQVSHAFDKEAFAFTILDVLYEELEKTPESAAIVQAARQQAVNGLATIVALARGDTNVNAKAREDALEAARSAVTLCSVLCRIFRVRRNR